MEPIRKPLLAGATTYPLTIENSGETVTFTKAPERTLALGHNPAETLYLLGLQDKMAATAFWPNAVLPELAEAHAKVPVLTVEFPTLEAILAQNPDFVPAMLVTLLGPDSKVAKREDFQKLGIPTYLFRTACSVVADTRNATGSAATSVYGLRHDLWTLDLLFQEITDLAAIYDAQDRGADCREGKPARPSCAPNSPRARI